MEIRTLKYFLAVAREENMSKAAEILHVTQPTLSKRLKSLEDELGKKLFTRHSFSIELTEEGVLLRNRAEDLIAMADKIEKEFVSLDDITGGELFLGGANGSADSYYIVNCGNSGVWYKYYEDSTRTKAIAVVYFTDISLTLEEYKSYLDGDTTVTDIGITEVNGIPCIRYQMSLEGFDILNVAFVLENSDILEVTFSPYDDPDYAGTIETMYSSIRKTI